MSEEEQTGERLGVLLAVLAALGFSMKAIFVKLAYAWPVSAVTLLAIRMLVALPVFAWVGWTASKAAPVLARRDKFLLALLGLLGYYASSLFDFWGLEYISAGLERLILFTYPTLTVLIGMVVFKRPLSGREIMAILFTYAGIGLAFVHDLGEIAHTGTVWLGAGLVFASSLCYAIYLSGSGPMILRLGAARFTALAMLVSTGAVLLHFGLSQPASIFEQPWQVYALGAAMAIFSTVLPVFMQSAAIRRIGAPRSALVGTLGPMMTIFLAWWWLGESISSAQIFGGALVIFGVWLVGQKKQGPR